jgi:hypothetical protein
MFSADQGARKFQTPVERCRENEEKSDAKDAKVKRR